MECQKCDDSSTKQSGSGIRMSGGTFFVAGWRSFVSTISSSFRSLVIPLGFRAEVADDTEKLPIKSRSRSYSNSTESHSDVSTVLRDHEDSEGIQGFDSTEENDGNNQEFFGDVAESEELDGTGSTLAEVVGESQLGSHFCQLSTTALMVNQVESATITTVENLPDTNSLLSAVLEEPDLVFPGLTFQVSEQSVARTENLDALQGQISMIPAPGEGIKNEKIEITDNDEDSEDDRNNFIFESAVGAKTNPNSADKVVPEKELIVSADSLELLGIEADLMKEKASSISIPVLIPMATYESVAPCRLVTTDGNTSSTSDEMDQKPKLQDQPANEKNPKRWKLASSNLQTQGVFVERLDCEGVQRETSTFPVLSHNVIKLTSCSLPKSKLRQTEAEFGSLESDSKIQLPESSSKPPTTRKTSSSSGTGSKMTPVKVLIEKLDEKALESFYLSQTQPNPQQIESCNPVSQVSAVFGSATRSGSSSRNRLMVKDDQVLTQASKAQLKRKTGGRNGKGSVQATTASSTVVRECVSDSEDSAEIGNIKIPEDSLQAPRKKSKLNK